MDDFKTAEELLEFVLTKCAGGKYKYAAAALIVQDVDIKYVNIAIQLLKEYFDKNVTSLRIYNIIDSNASFEDTEIETLIIIETDFSRDLKLPETIEDIKFKDYSISIKYIREYVGYGLAIFKKIRDSRGEPTTTPVHSNIFRTKKEAVEAIKNIEL